VRASFFSVLKVEDDEDEIEQETKAKQATKNQQQSGQAKKKNKKKKKAETAAETAQLRNLAFAQPASKSATSLSRPRPTSASGAKGDGKKQNASDTQWEQWKKVDAEFTADHYEKDLEQAILQSKIEFEENKDTVTENGDASRSGGKDKKKKNKKGTMSLEEFNQLPAEKVKGSDSEGECEYEIMPSKPKMETKIENPDPKFFVSVKEEAQHMIRKEIIQEEYCKQYAIESAQMQRHTEDLEKRDKEIERLTQENQKLAADYKQVKKRNQQLCHILAQGEMKDKEAVLLENEELKSLQEELTEEVSNITCELEKERSSVHSLKEEILKLKSKQGGR